MSWLTPWWSDIGAFVQMGQHGAYVWPAFGACALALAAEWWSLRRQAARIRQAAGAALPPPLTPAPGAGPRPALGPQGPGGEAARDRSPLLFEDGEGQPR